MTRITRWLPASTLTLGLAATCLVATAPAHAQQVDPELHIALLNESSQWSYLDDGNDPSNGLANRTDWTDPAFDDSSWQTAEGSFGALRGELGSLSGGFTPDNLLDQYKDGTTVNKEAFFFRTDFSVDGTTLQDDALLTGSLFYDDAAIVYVNGERIAGYHDDELPFTETGDDRNMVYGGSNSSAPINGEFSIPADILQDGENTIAVQLHNGRSSSSDVYFGLDSLDLEAAPNEHNTPVWRYLDDGTDPADGLTHRSDWAAPGFDDSAWPTAFGSFGAKRGELVSLGGGYMPENLLDQYKDGSSENKEAFFFRHDFNIEAADLTEDTVLRGAIRYDDAAIVYLNGEVVGEFSSADLDFADEGEGRNLVFGGANRTTPLLGEFIVPQELLQTGENTLAVQVHQGRATSSDIWFSMESLEFDEMPRTNDGQTSILLGLGADQTERRLSWFTDTRTQESVRLAPGAHDTMPADATNIAATVQGESADWGRDYVHATLSDLTPGTYSYQVGSDDGGWSAVEQFEVFEKTIDHEFTFIGDAQLGASGNLANDAAGWQRALDANDALFPESQFLLSAGDQVNDYSGSVNEYRSYVAPQQMRGLASAQTLGNHDYASGSPQELYHQHFNQPNLADHDNTQGSYWFKYNDVLHLNISTELRDWDAHREFLETTIAEQGDDVTWTMLTFHRPLYSVGPHSTSSTTNAIRDGLGPIINDLDIDVVLTGHDHSYSRSFLIDGAGKQVDPENSETIVDANGNALDTVQSEDRFTYDGTGSSPRLEDGNYLRVIPEEDETLFITANSSTGSKYYALQDINNYRDGFQPRFRDQQRKQNITNVQVDQCTVTSNTVELDGTVVDKVELLRDYNEPVITAGATTVGLNSTFDPVADVVVADDCATLTTDDVLIDGEVDTATPGVYTLAYSAVDDAGNETVVEREVTVSATEVDVEDGDNFDVADEPTPTPTTPATDGPTPEASDDRTATDADTPLDSDLARTGTTIGWIAGLGALAIALGMGALVAKRRNQLQ